MDAKAVAVLAAGSPPPRAVVGRAVNTKVSDRAVKVVVSVTERVAYEVRQTVEPLGFSVRFFNSSQRFDRAHFGSGDTMVRDVRWTQEDGEVVRLDVDTHLQWGWGYAAGYDESGNFFLEIRRPPDLTRGDNVLAGRKVVIDPGHGPEASAVGPLGTTERDVNLAIGFALEGLLAGEGAEVALTRRNVDGPGLGDRPWIAYEAKGDIFVSIHNNALPVTADPAETPRGYMHFYYHPQSRRLAEAVTAAYHSRHPDLPDEGLRWGDLAVCRGTFMPAILTESAYVILPEQEEKLKSPSYQKRLAGSLLEGIREFLKDYQRLQKRLPEERAAAAGR
ncbi:N-acetylmuramoyl-L-alanine amidase [bacterium]|nr:MAG: N-acetylmuramoyl-L-alanine amidase [bacterium]